MKSTTLAAVRLADFLESEDFEFDMLDPRVYESCGSAGCIGGHAALLWPGVRAGHTESVGPKGVNYNGHSMATKFGHQNYTWNSEKLAEKLGLDQDAEKHLCFPRPLPLRKVTREQAVRVLRHLALTGKVEWTAASERSSLGGAQS